MEMSYSTRMQGDRTAQGTTSFLDHAYDLHVEGLRDSLRYLPDHEYREYCRWVLNNEETQGQWLQVNGVKQLIHLTQKMVEGLLSDDEMMYLLPYSVAINTYFVYEVISDNLAIGLAKRRTDDTFYDERRELLGHFNTIISERISDLSSQPAAESLAGYQPLMQRISAFDQSLNPKLHRQIASYYLQHSDSPLSLDRLEYTLYANLVANIEACDDYKDVLRGYEMFSLLQNSLANRYEAVNCIVGEECMPNDLLIEVSTHTVSVIPTLAYYVGLIGENVRSTPKLASVIHDNSLLETLRDAAILVRLLNDAGTILLEQPEEELQHLFETMHTVQQSQGYSTFEDLFFDVAGSYNHVLTRLNKDLKFGETNVALYPVLYEDDVKVAIDTFADQLHYLRQLYTARQQSFAASASTLGKRLGGALIPQLITRFVKFHQFMYSQPFEKGNDYAL